MSRSDIYKRIIIIFALLIFIGSIIISVVTTTSCESFLKNLENSNFIDLTFSEIKTRANCFGVIMFLVVLISGFIFCMFFYLLADILDNLEIVSAQSIRATKVLEKEEEENKD